jgi:putative CocE/NonD family hydrolase
MKVLTKAIILLTISLCKLTAFAQVTNADDKYSRQEIMIPMRDGIKLHTVVYIPKVQTEPLPFLIERTPYGVNDYPSPEKIQYVKDMADDNYIFVYQDIRGRYLSEGKFMMQRSSRDKSKAGSFDEASDTYDTIDWLLKNIPNNNGKAGISSPCFESRI